MNTFKLVSQKRVGSQNQTERDWLEFVVDGRSLHEILDAGDVISPLGWGDRGFEEAALRQLLAQEGSELPDHRVMLYVCPECRDLGRGAVTVRIRRDGTAIVWDRFGWESEIDEERDLDSYRRVGPFRFNYDLYKRALYARKRELAG